MILSALRARQIQGGSVPMIKEPRHKATQIAQKELIQGLVKFRIPGGDDEKEQEGLEE